MLIIVFVVIHVLLVAGIFVTAIKLPNRLDTITRDGWILFGVIAMALLISVVTSTLIGGALDASR